MFYYKDRQTKMKQSGNPEVSLVDDLQADGAHGPKIEELCWIVSNCVL